MNDKDFVQITDFDIKINRIFFCDNFFFILFILKSSRLSKKITSFLILNCKKLFIAFVPRIDPPIPTITRVLNFLNFLN